MVEPVRSAADAREAKKATTAAAAMKKKLMMSKRPAVGKKEEQEKESSTRRNKSIMRKQQSTTAAAAEPESPSYRLALKSLFSCRNSHGHHSQQQGPPGTSSSRSKKLGRCSAPSICKLSSKDSDGRQQRVGPPVPDEMREEEEPCKRRASVSGAGAGASERCVKKPLMKSGDSSSASASNNKQQQQLTRRGGGSSLSSSSSSGGGGSFRAGMQLRRLSGCYECHMVVDPISGSTSMRAAAATICPCPDCGEIFVRQESLQLHQSIRHAVCELGGDDTSRNIIEIIFQSSWLKKQSPVCKVERILKVHNTARTLSRFEEYRDAVKGTRTTATKHPRCTADGNELLRFHCAALGCALGLNGATHLCDAAGAGCAACGIIRDGFRMTGAGGGVRTMATSGRAHDAAEQGGMEEQRRAMLVCRVIAGRVKRPAAQEVEVEGDEDEDEEDEEDEEEEYDSVAGSAGVYSNLEELLVFNPRAILPCFVVVYKA
ncbi:hypothetical protein U9M48_034365 [Paspalum notatum var. saurae]|uniref:C2H2-type domain-containing protein n=1 Tax=Paspalum notatum var. saurae TaxID=547442 RepID=A0AAQ3U9K8_PASNO